VAKAFVAANADDVRLIQLPSYCPELDPDELLHQDVKTMRSEKAGHERGTK